ncbi:response regulator [Marixanthomonas spongiae]|uniref:DNA-binding response regulator n=1 Tax=Marixanthomonas spongiae TaxID=2174845 RepID=A0A2U0I0X6_9FLAO|nr:response regulator transcription factor [Marixanthomonas spongiae]PVW14763.1 DNA-binding response regulator [Marixanthomonas spongiae]
MNKTAPHNIVIVDDHALFASSLEKLVNSFNGFNVLYHARNGKDLQLKLKQIPDKPELILLDLNMPVMDGFETMEWLRENQEEIKVLALTMEDDEEKIIKMLSSGAKGYLLKDIHPEKLNEALVQTLEKGFYHSEKVAESLLHSLNSNPSEKPEFKEREIDFMKLACTEMTYKEIADKMNLSPKTIDGYRQELFNKLDVKNRVGLVIYALKNDITKI